MKRLMVVQPSQPPQSPIPNRQVKSNTTRLPMVAGTLMCLLGISLGIYQWRLRSHGSNATVSPSVLIPSSSLPKASTPPTFKPASKGQALAPPGLFAPPRGEIRLVVISDLNSQYGSTHYAPEVTQAIALIPGWQPDFVLSGGDMVAGQSHTLNRGQIQAMWTAFDRTVAAPLRQAQLPLGFTIGNHDASGVLSATGSYVFAQERQLAADYWHQNSPKLPFVDRAQFPFYYTFAQDNIFYLVWDASTAKITPEHLAWVEKSLASSAAQKAKLRIMIGHLPLYGIAVGRNKSGEYLQNADALRSLMERYRVHTYISGHQHAYYPGHRGQLQLLHTGALGGGPRPLVGSNLPPQKTITVVDIGLAPASTAYTTYDMKTLQVIDQQQLPRQINGENGTVYRRDVMTENQAN